MYINRRIIFIGSILALCVIGCKKEDPIEISTIPQLEFLSINPSTAKEYQDKITITISYKDGDGDLGENTTDVKNLFLTDNRNGVTYEYRVPQLAPSEEKIRIQGNLPVVLKNTAIIGGGDSESVTFSIYMVDRAGNKSNTVNSSSITVTK